MALDADFIKLADQYLSVLQRKTGAPFIICDEQGKIVSANDRRRIGQTHHGAQRIMRGELDEAAITAEQAAADRRVREGYNCPIAVDGERVATVGMAGPIEQARPLVRISATRAGSSGAAFGVVAREMARFADETPHPASITGHSGRRGGARCRRRSATAKSSRASHA